MRLDRLLDDRRLDRAIARERRKRAENHEPVVHLEELAQAIKDLGINADKPNPAVS